MILRNLIFDPEIVEQRLRARVMSHHEQQASEHGNEQQHHELWPAYNLTAVQEQASSQVLFQQQLAIAQVTEPDVSGRGVTYAIACSQYLRRVTGNLNRSASRAGYRLFLLLLKAHRCVSGVTDKRSPRGREFTGTAGMIPGLFPNSLLSSPREKLDPRPPQASKCARPLGSFHWSRMTRR